MKYGRPVRELLADCVAVLPQPLAKADVFEWFRSNYPEVARGTVNTHIAGLTARATVLTSAWRTTHR